MAEARHLRRIHSDDGCYLCMLEIPDDQLLQVINSPRLLGTESVARMLAECSRCAVMREELNQDSGSDSEYRSPHAMSRWPL